MRSVYKYLAAAVAVLIVVQAAAIAWAVFGEGKYIDAGHNVNKSLEDAPKLPFPEVVGYIIHGINGEMLIPLVSLILLVVSFFAKVPDGVKWAGMVFGGVVIQVLLGLLGAKVPFLGALHGLNALLLFMLAIRATRQAAVVEGVATPEAAAAR